MQGYLCASPVFFRPCGKIETFATARTCALRPHTHTNKRTRAATRSHPHSRPHTHTRTHAPTRPRAQHPTRPTTKRTRRRIRTRAQAQTRPAASLVISMQPGSRSLRGKTCVHALILQCVEFQAAVFLEVACFSWGLKIGTSHVATV